MTPGEQQLDLVHVDDVVEAYCRLLAVTAADPARLHAGKQFALHAEKLVTLKELAGLFTRATGRSLNVHWGAKPYRAREIMTPWSGGQPLPGWRPRISLEEGLRLAYGD